MNIEDLNNRLIKAEKEIETCKEHIKDLNTLTNEIHDIATNLAVLTAKMAQTSEDVKDLKGDVVNLKEAPAKNWQIIVSSAISSIVGGLIAIAISMIFR